MTLIVKDKTEPVNLTKEQIKVGDTKIFVYDNLTEAWEAAKIKSVESYSFTYESTDRNNSERANAIRNDFGRAMAAAKELRERAAAMRAYPKRWVNHNPDAPGTWCAVHGYGVLHVENLSGRLLSTDAHIIADEYVMGLGLTARHGHKVVGIVQYNDQIALDAVQVAEVLEAAAETLMPTSITIPPHIHPATVLAVDPSKEEESMVTEFVVSDIGEVPVYHIKDDQDTAYREQIRNKLAADPEFKEKVACELRNRAAQMRHYPENWLPTAPILRGQWCAVMGRDVQGDAVRLLSQEAIVAADDFIKGLCLLSRKGYPVRGIVNYNDTYATDSIDVAEILEKAAANL